MQLLAAGDLPRARLEPPTLSALELPMRYLVELITLSIRRPARQGTDSAVSKTLPEPQSAWPATARADIHPYQGLT